ncbi:hypothetical protein TWF694_001156 [Orbilia ellipsospora]|uniref:Uncharacterized protein n=1 Tax=Orbilia ellipsospora TaxID=2528407 RepID=A0AAV9XSM9_9PEZI
MPIDPSIAAAKATVRLDDHTDWTARKVASYTRVLENALAKIKKEVQIASYSNTSISTISFKQLFNAPEPALKWEWEPKTEQELLLRMKAGHTLAQQPRKKVYADASMRRKGFHLQPRRPTPPTPQKEGPAVESVFKNYLQNASLRRKVLLAGANAAVRPHYATVLQQQASIVAPATDAVEVPSLRILSARAFGRAIVMARDPDNLQGDYSWYSYCDENSNMYNLLAETLRGHITQLLCNAMSEYWFPQDLASTMIAQSGNAGDYSLSETLFQATYRGSCEEKNRSVARRKGELAPEPFSSILYMPDILFRQMGLVIEERPEMMLEAWFLDVMVAGIAEISMHRELPKLVVTCLELLLGIEIWDEGVHRRRLNRTGKTMRKKLESFDKAWLFQSKGVIQRKAANVAQDLVERLYHVGWGDLKVSTETKLTANTVMNTIVERMLLWSKVFNHPHKEASEGSSITARTLALSAVILTPDKEKQQPMTDVIEELVRLLLVTMIEASEEEKIQGEDRMADTFDLHDLAKYVAEVLNKVYSTALRREVRVDYLVALALGSHRCDFTQTPAVGDKAKLEQKRQRYLIAIFAYHISTALAEISRSAGSREYAAIVESRLVELQISKKGLLKASDLKTPKFSNLLRDLAQTEDRNNRWVYEPMLNEWVEVPMKDDDSSSEHSGRKVSRKLNFSQQGINSLPPVLATPGRKVGANSSILEGDSSDISESEDYDEEDSTVYPASADTTMTEPDTTPPSSLPNILIEVCIPALSATESTSISQIGAFKTGNKISGLFRQSKRLRTGEFKGSQSQSFGQAKVPKKIKTGEAKDTTMSDSQEDIQEHVAIVPRKRGRPRKNTTQISKPPLREVSGYQPDRSEEEGNNQEEDLQPRKKRQAPLRQSIDQYDENIDIFQDELDLTSTGAINNTTTTIVRKVGRPSKTSKVGIFHATGLSKLNMKRNKTGEDKNTDEVEESVATIITAQKKGRRSLLN